MVQREVADRFFAQPRTKAYGAVSVLVQLSARKTGLPLGSADGLSSASAGRLRAGRVRASWRQRHPIATVRPVVEAAFAHRRKTLANSVAISGLAPRARAEEALIAIGRSTRVRAEELEPEEFVALAEHSDEKREGVRQDQPRSRGRAAPRRRQARGRHSAPAPRTRTTTSRSSAADALTVDGFAEDTIVRSALESLAVAAGVEPRWRARIEKRIPVAAGLGGGSSDAAAALQLANAELSDPLDPNALHAIAAAVGADVPFFLRQGAQVATGDGTELTGVDLPIDYHVVLVVPQSETKQSTAAVYEAFDVRRGAARVRATRGSIPSGARVDLGLARPGQASCQRSRIVADHARARRRGGVSL